MPVTDYTLPIDRANSPLMWGEVADLSNALIWKGVNEETTSPLATGGLPGLLLFGFGVVVGPGTDGLVFPSAVTDKFEGIVYATDTFEQRPGYSMDSAGRFGYPPRSSGTPGQPTFSSAPCSIIRRAGRIGVPIEAAVTRGGDVHMRCVLGAGVARGAFRGALVASETIQIPRARWLTTVAAPSAGTLGIGYITLDGVL